ncbi:MAG: Lrp/AsnC family transcriptional regulator [Candidatus Heimdallarchaeota archaeon]|nr:Lrp/AsnC family transcriptional regulator [Candidatus Heimdallarchaeota archaeon]
MLLKKNCSFKQWSSRSDDAIKFTPLELEVLKSNQLKPFKEKFYYKGIIRAFSLIFSKPTLDFFFKFFLRIKPKKFRDFTKIAEILTHNPHVVDLYRIDSELGLFAIFRVKSLYQLKEFIFSLHHEFDVDKTFTTLVMQEIIPTPHPPSTKIAKFLSGI